MPPKAPKKGDDQDPPKKPGRPQKQAGTGILKKAISKKQGKQKSSAVQRSANSCFKEAAKLNIPRCQMRSDQTVEDILDQLSDQMQVLREEMVRTPGPYKMFVKEHRHLFRRYIGVLKKMMDPSVEESDEESGDDAAPTSESSMDEPSSDDEDNSGAPPMPIGVC